MTQALQIIQADLQRHCLMNFPIEAYDAFEAACALEEAGIDPDELEFSPIDLVIAALTNRCLEALAA